ncbi:hypothetical protein P7K49_033499 [Saguinus oedipus]|uniref:Uncharacterized protein n=1 Tax=Saguinus oedipus TaxID=9490 RepID=A0ABQ9TTT9_SAGOE|nr:hypothetical protein P7K49_033499 [Saguinus oedipus]
MIGDPKGSRLVLICRNYRGDVDMSEVEHFMPILMEKEEEGMLSPILAHGGVRFMWIKHNNLYRTVGAIGHSHALLELLAACGDRQRTRYDTCDGPSGALQYLHYYGKGLASWFTAWCEPQLQQLEGWRRIPHLPTVQRERRPLAAH